MAFLPIIVAPDPRLKLTCDPVIDVTDELRQLMDDMLDTMYDVPGIGLAAPQVGVTKRVIVVDVTKNDDERHPYQMVKDLRTGVEKGNAQGVLDGGIDEFLEAALAGHGEGEEPAPEEA